MLIKRLLKMATLSICAIAYAYSAVYVHSGQTFSVNIDLSRPLSVVWPMEVSIVGDMGEKGLRIAPKVGRGWLKEAGGKATYRFYAPEDGRYHIWANCLWFDKCTNAVFARIDDMDKAVVGNDNIYNQWHWVRGFSLKLERGAHDLELSNHSDHISLQNVLLTNSATMLPEEGGLIFSDIFYDGFDGCHIGNFASWKPVCGEWLVKIPDEKPCFFENALIGKSQERALIIYRGDEWANFSLNVAVKSLPSTDVWAETGICFGVEDPNRYHYLKWRPVDGGGKCEMQICRNEFRETHVIGAFEIAWNNEIWNKVEISLDPADIAVKINDEELVKTPIAYTVRGGIGLLLEGEATAYFDDIHVRDIIDNQSQ
jgi:hypothetical protein